MTVQKAKIHFLYAAIFSSLLAGLCAFIIFGNEDMAVGSASTGVLYLLFIFAILASVFTIMRFVFHIDSQRKPQDDVKLMELAEDQDTHEKKHS